MVIEIENANYMGDYTLEINFSDGSTQRIDFEKFLMSSKNPMTKKFMDKELFKNFKIEYGDLIWNDFELCFPIWDLYKGKI
jgi:hypothetical protein